MDIDPDAPVQATRTVHIAAAPSVVWALLADIPSWPSWNSDIRDVSVPRGVRPGATFTWRSGPGRITSIFGAVEPAADTPASAEMSGHARRHPRQRTRATEERRREPVGASVRVIAGRRRSSLEATVRRRVPDRPCRVGQGHPGAMPRGGSS